ncbi:prolyl 4-hydroxylase subunit alpha-2-like [Drosophila montana]|uniref:prolyl 4-hydroxylase subunit alpha-2-like n=1 Tax=Drosophila montana TaxID=40370 RepID=UPI00313CBAF3
MSKLVQMENKLMSRLQVIAKDMQQKLNMIRLFQQMLKRSPEDSYEKHEEFVANPLNAFALLRRLQQDWPKWLMYLKTQPEIEEMQQEMQKAPSEKDLQTAIKGLLRIERVYDLESSHMAKGLLLGKQYDSFLTSPDCEALADNLFNRTEYSRSTHWYRTAIRLYKKPYGKLYNRVLGLKRKGLNRKYAQAIVYDRKQFE